MDSHRLITLAGHQGYDKQNVLVDELFQNYFCQGKYIGDKWVCMKLVNYRLMIAIFYCAFTLLLLWHCVFCNLFILLLDRLILHCAINGAHKKKTLSRCANRAFTDIWCIFTTGNVTNWEWFVQFCFSKRKPRGWRNMHYLIYKHIFSFFNCELKYFNARFIENVLMNKTNLQ